MSPLYKTLILQRSLIPLSLSEAREEFGDEVTAKLKLTKDGRFVLWPQPSDDPEDPQNVRLFLSSLRYLTKTTQWSDRRKSFQLFIIVLVAIVPEFDSGIGLTSLLSH